MRVHVKNFAQSLEHKLSIYGNNFMKKNFKSPSICSLKKSENIGKQKYESKNQLNLTS